MDILHRITNFVDQNRYFILAVALTALISVWLLGCQPTTTSLIDKTQQVTATQMQSEIATLQEANDTAAAKIEADTKALAAKVDKQNKQIQAAADDLEQQEKVRAKVVETVGGIATAVATGGFSAPTAISSVLTLLGVLSSVGLGADNLRKNKIISNLKASQPTTAPAGS